MGVIKLPRKFECLLKKRARYKVFHGGRGGGKSRAFAAALIYLGNMLPLRVLCAREVQVSIKDSVKRILDDEIVRQGLQNEYDSTMYEIRHKKTGASFIFTGLRSVDSDKVKSLEGIDICWIEEAHGISQASLDVLLPTIRKENSEIWFSFNSKLVTDPVYQMFLASEPPPNSIVVECNYYDNPWFPEVLREQMEWDRSRDADKYAHVWLGKPVQHSEAQVFHGCWKVEPTPDTHPNETFYFGADWGFAQDPTALIRCWIDDNKQTLYIDYEAGGVGIEIDNTPALFDMIPLSRRFHITADSARPETISYMCRQGFRVRSARKGAGSIEDGIAKIKSYNVIIHPRCKRVIDEFSLYSYKIDPRTNAILPIVEDKNNHFIDSLRYALESVQRPRHPSMLQNATHYDIDVGSYL